MNLDFSEGPEEGIDLHEDEFTLYVSKQGTVEGDDYAMIVMHC